MAVTILVGTTLAKVAQLGASSVVSRLTHSWRRRYADATARWGVDRCSVRSRPQGQRHVDGVTVVADRDRQAAAPEHRQHRQVAGQDIGLQLR